MTSLLTSSKFLIIEILKEWINKKIIIFLYYKGNNFSASKKIIIIYLYYAVYAPCIMFNNSS